MLVPDPNFFGGIVSYSDKGGEYADRSTLLRAPFGAPNWPAPPAAPSRANYRLLGVADLIDAANRNREPRCSGRLAAHVVDVMESILASAARAALRQHPLHRRAAGPVDFWPTARRLMRKGA